MAGAATAEVRDAAATDLPALEALHCAAFPDEDPLPLVRALAGHAEVVSLVAENADGLAGHVALTICPVAGATAALLGPLAIAPPDQRRGLGGALIRAGVARMRSAGAGAVSVLGDPAYYGRHGFQPETSIAPPYPLPEEWRGAWQAIGLSNARLAGQLQVPAPWQIPSLWGG